MLLGSLSLSTVAAADQFYKWTDAQGATHYTVEPPPKTAASAAEVKISTKVPSGSSAAASNLEKQRGDAAKKLVDKALGKDKDGKTDPAAAKTDGKVPAEYAERCKTLQGNLQAMQEHGRVKMTNEKGEVTYLSDEEKQKQMDDTQRQIKAFCQ